jgi:hypothetical protein
MSTEVKPNNEESAALDHIDAELKKFQRSRTEAAAPLAKSDLGEICKVYNGLKGSLEILVKFLKKIPGVGAKAAAVIEFLMGIADTVCAV